MSTEHHEPNRDPWLLIQGHPVINLHPPIEWQPGGPGWILITDDRILWEAGKGPWAIRAASASAEVDLGDRDQVYAAVEAARPTRVELAVAIEEKVPTAWGSWLFRTCRSPTRSDPSPAPRGIGAYYSLIKRCPCGSGEIGGRSNDERQQPALACDGCRGKLLARIVEADLREGGATGPARDPVTHWENSLRRKGCDLVPIVAGEPRPIRKGNVTILCPSVPCSFVLVPDALAEASLMKGRFA